MSRLSKYGLEIILVIMASLIAWPLLIPGYFSHHDDLQVMRIFEMRRCFSDLQIPCRWVPDMGYGNGYPLFNYYNPLPYYIGVLFSYIFGYIISAKILFLIPIILSALSMYLLAREIFGRQAAILAAILFQYAPYKALDLYVRGALAESFALSIAPFCFFFALRILKKKAIKDFVGLSLSVFVLLTSHNIMAIFFIPLLIIFILSLRFFKVGKNILPIFLSLLLGFGLSAFFTIPAFFEKNLVQIENLTKLDLDFRAHFVTLNQLFFDRSWGYGASMSGPSDTISLQIGWPHWILALLGGIFGLIFLKKLSSKIAILFFAFFILAVFMTHIRSAFIWESLGILHFAQFPWRFLAVVIFSASLLGGYLISLYPPNYRHFLLTILIISIALLNFPYFRPAVFYSIGDNEKLSGSEWEAQQKAAILDYLPKTAVQPREAAPSQPLVISGQAIITNFINKSNSFQFNAKITEETKLEIPVFDFPSWQVWSNHIPIIHSHDNYLGRIAIQLKEGDYYIQGKFQNTFIRSLANGMTILSFLILLLIPSYGKIRKIFK